MFELSWLLPSSFEWLSVSVDDFHAPVLGATLLVERFVIASNMAVGAYGLLVERGLQKPGANGSTGRLLGLLSAMVLSLLAVSGAIVPDVIMFWVTYFVTCIVTYLCLALYLKRRSDAV